MLFVDDDQREIGDWSKNGGSGADHDASVSALDAMPLLGAFAIGKRRMQDRDFVAENLMEIGGDGGSKADLGNEKYGGAPGFEHGAHGSEIDGRLP